MYYTRNTMVKEKIISILGLIVFVVCIVLWNFMQDNPTENPQSTQFDKELKVNETPISSASDVASIKK